MISRGVIEQVENFNRAQTFTTTAGPGGWAIKDTSSAGAPTYLCITEDAGAAKLTLAATSEEEIVTLYHLDVLTLDLANLQRIEMIAKVAGIDSVTTLVFGVADAQNDTEDSVATNAWFRMQGSASTTAVVCESDDGTTDNDDKATGTTLAATYKKFVIDFTNGLADIRFFIDGERVAAATTFSMSAVTAGQNVQPFIQLHKASGTGVPSITIAQIVTQQKYAYGA
jgi:hypothetical protein